MSPLFVIVCFLSWEPERQLICLPDLAEDSGSPKFIFSTENPTVKIAKIVADLHCQREGESIPMWRERQGFGTRFEQNALNDLDTIVEGLVVTLGMKESLFTRHGIKKSADWRLVRKLAREAKRYFGEDDEPSEMIVTDFLKTYKFDE